MTPDNIVVFKGNKDGIIILLDEAADFEILKLALVKKVIESRKFFGETKTTVYFKGRKLSTPEEEELIKIITKNTNLNVNIGELQTKTTHKDNNNENNNNEILQNSNVSNLISSKQNDCIFHMGNIRNGQSIKHNGSIVIIGDVNPGAEIIAHANIIILGTLKGVVHAGCSGSKDCFITALDLSPSQIRIADLITYISAEMINQVKPSMAYIEGTQIHIAPLL